MAEDCWQYWKYSIVYLQDTVKKIVSGLTVKELSETAKNATKKDGRLLVLVNEDGEDAQIVVASSGDRNASQVCGEFCQKIGGGGGGSPTLAQGGGKTQKLKESMDSIK